MYTDTTMDNDTAKVATGTDKDYCGLERVLPPAAVVNSILKSTKIGIGRFWTIISLILDIFLIFHIFQGKLSYDPLEKFDTRWQKCLIFRPDGHWHSCDHIRVHFHLQNKYSENFKLYNRNKQK